MHRLSSYSLVGYRVMPLLFISISAMFKSSKSSLLNGFDFLPYFLMLTSSCSSEINQTSSEMKCTYFFSSDIEINKIVKGKPPIKPKKQVRGVFIHFLFSLFIGQNVTKFLSA
jgi:hypothetical protein